ncbi:MAG: PQQ-binding-like beta-propeller repeat protein [Steroidobacteraceae bacterium]
MQRRVRGAAALLLLGLARAASAQSPDASDWGHVGGDPGGQYYSHLNQITRDNVTKLERAWTFHAGEPLAGGSAPVLGFGLLYFVTPSGVLIALEPATGKERWRFARARATPQPGRRPRTLAIWQQDENGTLAPSPTALICNRRAFLPMQQHLMVLDASTGQPCEGFNDGIAVEGEVASLVLHRGLVITLLTGGALRAFDASTGAPRWALDLHSLAAGADGLDTHGQLSLDAALGLVFVPGASQLAVDTSTGKPAWLLRANAGETAQPAAQIALVALNTPAGPLPAVVQPTPAGELRLLHRDRGTSIGRTSLLLLARGNYSHEDAWGITLLDRALCARRITKLARASSVNPTNVAIDMDRNRMIVALNDLPVRLAPLLIGAQKAHEEPMLSIFGMPCVRPPWGSLMSVDLQKHSVVWQIPLGTSGELLPAFLPTRNFGSPNSGGPMVTAGGLIFVAATPDRYLRAFDVDTGKNLWQSTLPAAGNSTPISYRAGSDQRQYVVVTAGGNPAQGNAASDQMLAFALPRTLPGR